MTSALRTAAGQAVVPGNRWDLVDANFRRPRVSVVVPHYQAPEDLRRLLAGLALQTYPHDLIDVVVADDGSKEAPTPEPTIGKGIPVTLLRQDDRGFRAAAARNLGVTAARGDVLCFLDQDVVPEPEYVDRLTRLCGVLPDALVVGSRRHADLAGWSDDRIRGWLTGTGPGPELLGDPDWLTDAYGRTRNLLDADDSGFRFVISAVMACSRRLFDELGGFDESFTEYGGEDWEFAYRAWNAGAVLAHEPAAVAWHDGPDWAGRGTPEERTTEKAAEARMLAERIPMMRREPWPDAELVDVCLIVDDADGVRSEEPSRRVRASARYTARVHDVTGFSPDLLARALDELRTRAVGQVTVVASGRAILSVTSTRAESRAERWGSQFPDLDLVDALFGRVEMVLG